MTNKVQRPNIFLKAKNIKNKNKKFSCLVAFFVDGFPYQLNDHQQKCVVGGPPREVPYLIWYHSFCIPEIKNVNLLTGHDKTYSTNAV